MSKPRRRKQKKQVKPELKLRQFAATELSDQLAALPCAADLPRFMVDTVAGAYTPADAELVIEGFGAAATRPVTLRANTLKATAEDIAAALDAADIAHRPVAWYPDAFILPEAQVSDLWDLDIYRDGKIYLQSLSSMMPPLVLGAQAGEDILDMCAAPGGKTTQIAALTQGQAHLTACEMSIPRAEKLEANLGRQGDSTNDAGHGVTATIDGKHVVVGNAKMLAAAGVEAPDCEVVGTILHVLVDGIYAGHIVIADTIKADAEQTIRDLHAAGAERTVMLTGDREEVAAAVAKRLGLDEFHAQLLPGDKVERVEALLAAESGKGKLAFVGDGINDAPVLTRADVGIAMGAMGSDAAIEAADVVLMDDKPSNISRAIRVARKTMTIVWQNIIFALGIKLLILVLAALGIANMWLAVFGDVGVAIIAILNAMRAMGVKNL